MHTKKVQHPFNNMLIQHTYMAFFSYDRSCQHAPAVGFVTIIFLRTFDTYQKQSQITGKSVYTAGPR